MTSIDMIAGSFQPKRILNASCRKLKSEKRLSALDRKIHQILVLVSRSRSATVSSMKAKLSVDD